VAGVAGAAVLMAPGWLHPRAAAVRAADNAGPAVVGVTPSPGPSDPTTAAARALLAPAPPPATLVIPALQVRAVVEAVGTDAQGRMAAPSQADHVAWFNQGPAPGDAGDALIDGHLDWTNGPAVFWLLGKLRAGDEVDVLRADGSQARFQVDATATVRYDARMEQLFVRTGPPSVSLITCSGSWDRQHGTYQDRLLVHATLIAAPPSDKPGDEGG
jgi:sortase (surface protein transpeptidase)